MAINSQIFAQRIVLILQYAVYDVNSLHAKIESNLKKILQRNRRRHFDKRDALI